MTELAKRTIVTDSDPAYELSSGGTTLLQRRLVTYGIAVPVVAAGYFPLFYLTWSGHPQISNGAVLSHIFSPWTFVLLGVHAFPWLSCRWRPLPSKWLRVIDVATAAGVGAVYGRVLLTHPSPGVAPLEGLLGITSVLGMRALLVPSTGFRTAVVGFSLCLVPGLTLLTHSTHFSTSFMNTRTLAPLFLTWSVVAIALTSVASMVLYGLRRQVQDARRLGQYTLVERLGEGGMGVVYRAEHAMLRRPTAVKLLRPTKRAERIARFEQEVQLMAELTHPNTVAVYDYGRTADGTFYYAMEYLDGVDLQALVDISGPVGAPRVVHLLRQACGSLDEAHRRGLIHRDVKPANLFVCRAHYEPDTVKVLDFGLVKDVSADEPSVSVAGSMVGTPLYMSPEAITNEHPVDTKSDLYSLGATAYMLLTGTPVFPSPTPMEVFAQHVTSEVEPPSHRLGQAVPADLEALVLACLAKDPSRRPDSARALRDALDACSDAGRWTAKDAEAWWETHGAAIHAQRRHVEVVDDSEKTIVVNPRRTTVDARGPTRPASELPHAPRPS